MDTPILRGYRIKSIALILTFVVIFIARDALRDVFKDEFAPGEFIPSQHPARNVKFWNSLGIKGLPLEKKVATAPPLLIDYIQKDNLRQGFHNRPAAVQLEPDFKNDIETALKELPENVKKVVNADLFGIVVVRDLGTSGYANTVILDTGEIVGAFIVLDAFALDRLANEWITYKENSPFIQDSDYQITAEIESGVSDNRKNALQFVLLHELGHVVAATGDLHPPWNSPPAPITHPSKYPFSALSWTLGSDNSYKTLFDDHFKLREQISYYRTQKTKLPISEAIQIYSDLEKTNFATLYAAINPADDFAEAFATYVHIVLMKRPYGVKISNHGSVVNLFSSCWEDQRCDGKKAIVEDILKEFEPL